MACAAADAVAPGLEAEADANADARPVATAGSLTFPPAAATAEAMAFAPAWQKHILTNWQTNGMDLYTDSAVL